MQREARQRKPSVRAKRDQSPQRKPKTFLGSLCKWYSSYKRDHQLNPPLSKFGQTQDDLANCMERIDALKFCDRSCCDIQATTVLVTQILGISDPRAISRVSNMGNSPALVCYLDQRILVSHFSFSVVDKVITLEHGLESFLREILIWSLVEKFVHIYQTAQSPENSVEIQTNVPKEMIEYFKEAVPLIEKRGECKIEQSILERKDGSVPFIIS